MELRWPAYKDTDADAPFTLRGLDEDGLREADLQGEWLAQRLRNVGRLRENREQISGQRAAAEDLVDVEDPAFHAVATLPIATEDR
jgi:hypothetical protein